MPSRPWIRSFLPGVLVVALAAASAARAAGFDLVVNSAADEDDGARTAPPGGCTLREAIAAGNAGAERSIGFDPAVFPPGAQTLIQVATPLPAIARSGASIDGTGTGVQIDGGDAVAGSGLAFASPAGVALSGVSRPQARPRELPRGGVLVCAGGLPSCDAPLTDVLVENVVARSGEDGVRVLGSTASGVALRNVVASLNGSSGILVGASGDVFKVSVAGCAADTSGIAVSAGGELVAATVADNVVVDSSSFGILLSAVGDMSKPRIAGNRVTGSALDGIRLHADASIVAPRVEGNDVANSGADGIYVETFAGLSLGRIVGNGAVRNAEFGIRVEKATRTLVQANRADGTRPGSSSSVPATEAG